MKTQIVAFALIMVVALGATALPAMAADDTSEGSFTLSNAAPVVGAITLYEYVTDAWQEDGDGIMSPQTDYKLGVMVSDANTLNDITEIKVVIYDAEYTSGPTNTVDRHVTYIWTPNVWVEDSRPADTNTWGTILHEDCTVPTLTELSGEWIVKFKPGKVAREVAWKATVTVTDGGAPVTKDKDGLSMDWYGELATEAEEDNSFDFSTVGLAAGPISIITPADNKVDFTAITNGNYKLQSETTDWTHGQDPIIATVTLDWDGTLNDEASVGHFALENYGSDTTGSDDYFVRSSPVTIQDEDNEVSNYLEAGNSEPVYMWLYTADEGIMPYTYSGTYILTLSNYLA